MLGSHRNSNENKHRIASGRKKMLCFNWEDTLEDFIEDLTK